MRVGIIASLHHPIRPPFAGGLERHTHVLATGLRRRGHDVVVFAGSDADETLGVVPIADRSTPLRLRDDVARDVNAASRTFMAEHHAYLELMLGLQRHDLDVVHVNALHYLPVAMSSAITVPMTLTLHTPPTPWLLSALDLAAGSVTIAAVSRATAAQWRDHIAVDHVITNGVDLDAFRPGHGPVGDHVVWTGRICTEKGLLDALRAARLSGRDLHVAGPVSDQATFEAFQLACRSGDRYLGHLDGDDLRDAVRGAAAQVVTPKWEEPYGLVVAEALAMGVPVAAYARGGIPEILDDRSGVLAPADDVAALAAAIDRATDLDPANCRARAVQVADAERMLDDYEMLFRSVVAGALVRP